MKLLLIVLLVAVVTGHADTNSFEQSLRLAASGDKLSDAQVAEMEQCLTTNPGDMDARTKLLGYYLRRQFFDEAVRQKHVKSVLWIIANHPESDIAGSPFVALLSPLSVEDYQQARQLWAVQVVKSTNNPAVLANAASFVLIKDKDLAEKYLAQAEQLEPGNPKWPERLAFLYRLEANSLRQRNPDASCQASARALGKMEQYFQMTGLATNQSHLFLDAAGDAFHAGELRKAREFAGKSDSAYAHVLLGQIDLQEGKLDSAKAHLMATGKVETFPQNSLELAKAFLAKGEKNAVIEYLDLCKASWKTGQASLTRWQRELRETGTTDFRQSGGMTPEQIQADLRSKMTPEQFAAFSNRLTTSVRKIAYQPIIISPRWGISVSDDHLLDWLDGLWQKRNMTGLEAQMSSGGDGIPSLLTKAVYSSFVKGDRAASEATLQKAETLARQHSLKGFAEFEEAFRVAEKSLPAGKAFEKYPEKFPLRDEILKVGRELQAIADEQLKIWSRRKYFECRAGEVFYIDESDLDGKIVNATKGISGVITPDKRAAQEQALAGIGNDSYLLDVPYYLKNYRQRLQPRPGTHGTGLTDLDQADSAFLKALAKLDRQSRILHFVVRADSTDVFRKAKSLAEAAGFEVSSESLPDNQPITLGPSFDANGIAASYN